MWLSGPCIASIRGSDRTSHDYQVAVAIVACHFALAPGYPHNHFQIPWQHRDLHSAWCKTESLRQTECKKCARTTPLPLLHRGLVVTGSMYAFCDV
ncbi:hypothetical protein I7I53_09430 [Histoplasma capsulatum var. duboisii H88]|uniref:Uncharacterized protein n=1 Tax=Ajellomyces capsulatus (strain H88) TaxID=544711 RepID=A0A8A1L4Y0_AJEC8|nr:hypothetical protein I7I53_09430 [Histoplasma capsulatum var. duboisii H88]